MYVVFLHPQDPAKNLLSFVDAIYRLICLFSEFFPKPVAHFFLGCGKSFFPQRQMRLMQQLIFAQQAFIYFFRK